MSRLHLAQAAVGILYALAAADMHVHTCLVELDAHVLHHAQFIPKALQTSCCMMLIASHTGATFRLALFSGTLCVYSGNVVLNALFFLQDLSVQRLASCALCNVCANHEGNKNQVRETCTSE